MMMCSCGRRRRRRLHGFTLDGRQCASYGRVQSVKLLPRIKEEDGGGGLCATVSFMDIKSAAKAHDTEHKLEDCLLTTEYHEPAAIPSSGQPPLPALPLYASSRFQHGAATNIKQEEISSFERSSHFYERSRESEASYLRRSTSTYHVSPPDTLRGRTRDRIYRNGPYTPIIESVVSRSHRPSWNSYDGPTRYPSTPATPDISYQDERREPSSVVVLHNKLSKSSRSGSHGSESGSSRSRSRSRSSSSSSHSGSSSCSSPSSSHSDKSTTGLQSTVAQSSLTRPTAICVRNLPARSSDTSLKDGLFHEYKKYGKVMCVKVVGSGADRYGIVVFKKADDVEKALQISHDKLFFGCKIDVAPYHGQNVDDNEFRPYEAELDEFHPKATRTLFIGNLEKDITATELQKHFKQFGEIIEIDIKKQSSGSVYAFVQYCDIVSVVRAMRAMDGEYLGHTRINLGYGKSLATACVWLDGIAETVSEKSLSVQFSQFGPVSHVAIDRSRGHALVFFQQILFAQLAVNQMRGIVLRGRKLQVDFASRECQEAFYEHLDKFNVYENSTGTSPQHSSGSLRGGFETPSSSGSSGGKPSSRHVVSSSRYPRHLPTSRFDFSDYPNDVKPCSVRSYEDIADDAPSDPLVTVMVGPPDIRHLQKERHALLEQLEDCPSSGEEGSSRRRCRHHRSQSGEGSRPGTPLCDERPENLIPVEPRKTPRDKPGDPLSLPLPRFASQVFSPRPTPPSPPASPPRPDSSSSDSQPPPSPEWEERLRSLDEKYEKWSGSRTATARVDSSSVRIRHKLLDLDVHELQPSEIVKSVLARRSVFDEDSKRLENFREKYEPKEFVPSRPNFQSSIRTRLDVSSPLPSPSYSIPKSPASSPAPAKGLQYPFPSHPPVLPTSSVATGTSMAVLTTPTSPVSDYGTTRFEPVSASSIEEAIGKRRSRDDESVLKWLNHSERKSSIGEPIPAIAHVDPRKHLMDHRRGRESTDSKESLNLKEVEFRENAADRLRVRDLDELRISSQPGKHKLETNPRADSRLPTLDHSNLDSSSKPKSIDSLDRKIDCFSSPLDKRDAVSVDPRLEKRETFPSDPRLERGQTCSSITYDYTCSTKVPDFLGKRYELKLDRDDQIQTQDNHKNVPDSKDSSDNSFKISLNPRHPDSRSAIELKSKETSGKCDLVPSEVNNIDDTPLSCAEASASFSCSKPTENNITAPEPMEFEKPRYESISDSESSFKEEIHHLQKDMEISDDEFDSKMYEKQQPRSPIDDIKPPVLDKVVAETPISPDSETIKENIDPPENVLEPVTVNEVVSTTEAPVESNDVVKIKHEIKIECNSLPENDLEIFDEVKIVDSKETGDQNSKFDAVVSPKNDLSKNFPEESENRHPLEDKSDSKTRDTDSDISSKSDADSPKMPELKPCVTLVEKVEKEHKPKDTIKNCREVPEKSKDSLGDSRHKEKDSTIAIEPKHKEKEAHIEHKHKDKDSSTESRHKDKEPHAENRHREKENRLDKSDSKPKDDKPFHEKFESKRKDSVSEKIDLKIDAKHDSRHDYKYSSKRRDSFSSEKSDHRHRSQSSSEHKTKDSERTEAKRKDSFSEKSESKNKDICDKNVHKAHDSIPEKTDKRHESSDKSLKSHESGDKHGSKTHESSERKHKDSTEKLPQLGKLKDSSFDKASSKHKESSHDKSESKRRNSHCDKKDIKQRKNCENRCDTSSGKVEESKSEVGDRKKNDETKKEAENNNSNSKPHINSQIKKSEDTECSKIRKEKERDSEKDHSIKKSKTNFIIHSPEYKEESSVQKQESTDKSKRVEHSEFNASKNNKCVDRHKSGKDHNSSISVEKEKEKKKDKDNLLPNNVLSKQKCNQSNNSVNKHSKESKDKETKDKDSKRKESGSASAKQNKDLDSSEHHKEVNFVHTSAKNQESKKEVGPSESIKKDNEKKKKNNESVDPLSKIKEILKVKEIEHPDNGRHKDKIKSWEHISAKFKDNNRIKNNQLNDSVYEERKKDFFDGLYKNDIDCNSINDVNHVKEITREQSLSFKELNKEHDVSKYKIHEKKRESCDRERRKDDDNFTNHVDFKSKDSETSSKDKCKSKRNKEVDNFEKRKEREPSVDNIYDEKRSESIKKERRKERMSTSSLPATIGSKRRVSSQDSLDGSDEKSKPERRDSKDSSRSYGSSKKDMKVDKHNRVSKSFDEKMKEDEERPKKKEFTDEKRPKSINRKESSGSSSSCSEKIKELSTNEKSKDKETGDKRKEPSNMEKMKDYSSSCEKLNKDKKSKQRTDSGNTCSESEFGSGDDDKSGKRQQHSIFDIVDDEPAYISMYDKVKARSCKNMQKQKEERKQERLKEKFNQLKQSRAKREEKKRSTSYDEDSDSERGIGRRSSKLLITSSEEDNVSEYDMKHKAPKVTSESEDDIIRRQSFSARTKNSRIHSEESDGDVNRGFEGKNGPNEREIFSDNYINENSVDDKPAVNYDSTCPSNDDTSFSRSAPRKKSHKKKQKRQRSLDNDESGSKKHSSKKHRRKFSHETDEKSTKIRRKKLNAADFFKKEDSMEDIFGPLSDDSSDKNQYDRKWQVTQVYGTDSESEKETMNKREKRRKERKKELEEMGDAIEAGLLESCSSPPPPEPVKIKKKKRKKSKEEKSKHSSSKDKDTESMTSPLSPPVCHSSPPVLLPMVSHNKKLDIPGFGSKVDENIHETAVKSISEAQDPIVKEEATKSPVCASPAEEKPTVIISQEETEDAVAALLEDAFGGAGFDDSASYADEPSKPETPTSEPDLRIDTDTEDSFFTDDIYALPKTPDLPATCRSREGLEERIAALATTKPDKKEDPADVEMPEIKSESPARMVKDEAKLNDAFDTVKSEPHEEKLKIDEPMATEDHKPQIFEDTLENEFCSNTDQSSKKQKSAPSKFDALRFVDSKPEVKKDNNKTNELDDLSLNETLSGKPIKYRYPPRVNSKYPPKILSSPQTSSHEIGLASHLPGPLSIKINDNAMKTSPVISPSPPRQFQSPRESLKNVEKSLTMPVVDGPIANATPPSKNFSVLSPNQKLAAFNEHSPKSSISPNPKSTYKFAPSSPAAGTHGVLSPSFGSTHPAVTTGSSHMKSTSVVSPSYISPVTSQGCGKAALSPIPANFIKTTSNSAATHVGISSHTTVAGFTGIISHTGATSSPTIGTAAPLTHNVTSSHSPLQSHLSIGSHSNSPLALSPGHVSSITAATSTVLNRNIGVGLLTTVGFTGAPVSHQNTISQTAATCHTSPVNHHPPSLSRPVNHTGHVSFVGGEKIHEVVITTAAPIGSAGVFPQKGVNSFAPTTAVNISSPSQTSMKPTVVSPLTSKSLTTSSQLSSSQTTQSLTATSGSIIKGLATTGTLTTTSFSLPVSAVKPTAAVISHTPHMNYQPLKAQPFSTTVVTHSSYPGSSPSPVTQISPKSLFMHTNEPLSMSVNSNHQPTRPPISSVISTTTKPQLNANPAAQLKVAPFTHTYRKPGAKFPYDSMDQIQNLSNKIDNIDTKVDIAAYQVTDMSDKFHLGPSKEYGDFPSKDIPSPPSFMKHDLFNNPYSMKESPGFNIQSCIESVKSSLNEECLKPLNTEAPSLSKAPVETDKFSPKVDVKSPSASEKKPSTVENHLDDKENVSVTKNEPNWLTDLMNRCTSSTETAVKTEEVLKESKLSQIVSEMESRLNDELEAKRQKQAEDLEKVEKGSSLTSSSSSSGVILSNTSAVTVVSSSASVVTSSSTQVSDVSPKTCVVTPVSSVNTDGSCNALPDLVAGAECTLPVTSSEVDTVASDLKITTLKEIDSPDLKMSTRKETIKETSVPPVIIRVEESGSSIVNLNDSKKTKEIVSKTSTKTELQEETANSKEESGKLLADANARRGRRRRLPGGGGRVMTRRAKLQGAVEEEKVPEPADIYEFKDDSDEEVSQQPRLILTIKSPPENQNQASIASTTTTTTAITTTPVTTTQVVTSVATIISTSAAAVVTTTAAVTAASTRKSRRLQEKDGSRSTVDDTIDEVVRGLRSGAANTRRSARAQQNTLLTTVLPDLTRRSPRRKQAAAQQAASPVPSVHDTPTPPAPASVPASLAPPAPAPVSSPAGTVSEAPLPSPPSPAVPSPAQVPSCAPTEPTMIIDPVSGLLVPMQESEEGMYVPVASDLSKAPVENNDTDEPPEKKARASSPRPCVAVAPNNAIPSPTKSQLPVGLINPNPAAVVSPSSVVKPCSVSPSGPCKPNTPSPALPNVAKVGPQTTLAAALTPPTIVKAPVSLCAAPPLNHKAHLLQAVANQAKTPVPMTPKAHILQSINVIEGGRTTPLHNGPVLTASMASPPLKTPVTPASTRIESGCIVVANPPAQPPRSAQVMQAGLPVPAFEASLHGVVAELLPNPQWPPSPPPAHQHPPTQGEVQHMGYMQPPHYVHPQLVYQQYLRETALGYHITPGSECEDSGASPPLELRRATDSPAVATLYVPRHLYYDGPPPAHRPSQPRLQVATPPHASQVPPQADSLLILLQRYPVMWQGLLALKNDQAAVQMHFVWGHPHVATDSLPCNSDGTTPPLRIAQRMRLEQTQLDGVARKMQIDNEHCMLLALPCGRDHLDVLQQSNNLRSGFITYLQQKQAAGIVNIAAPGSHQAAYVVHIFPSCEFANDSLARIAPDLLHRVADIAHLLIVIATV
ncbi:uncharacterized protein spen isoform X2 [Bemisia tabaci]|uniref:uncharacterized protein spen isoform X2 n=1 Tax=Bemisia tabaci TaxID=7038 RepID=UPI003B285CA1